MFPKWIVVPAFCGAIVLSSASPASAVTKHHSRAAKKPVAASVVRKKPVAASTVHKKQPVPMSATHKMPPVAAKKKPTTHKAPHALPTK